VIQIPKGLKSNHVTIMFDNPINFLLNSSDFDGLLRLQRLYNNIPKNNRGEFQFQIDRVKKIQVRN